MSEPSLGEQLDAVTTALDLAAPWGDAETLGSAGAVVERARTRLGFGLDHTVVALGGPTGAGKSTLFNSLVGQEVSTTGVRRPTTGQSHAAVWSDTADPLLDWLELRQRHRAAADESRAGLVLVDLPDHDSTVTAHRIEVDRLVEMVDLFVWVVDPQKYADQSLHEGYIRRLSHHGDVMVFVLSKTDLLAPAEVDACREDLRSRLIDDGIDSPRIITASVVRDGSAEIESMIIAAVEQRRSAVDRVRADLRHAVADLAAASDAPDKVPSKAADRFVDVVGAAGGLDEAARIAAAQHRHRARATVGWPVLAPLRRWRRAPATRWDPPSASPVAGAEIDRGLRRLAEDVSDQPDETWRRTVRDDLSSRRPAVLERLDEVVGSATVDAPPRRWWRGVRILQRTLVALAVLGGLWVLALVLADSALSIDIDAITPETPGAAWMPLPTAVLLVALAAGWLVGVLAGALAGVGARRVARSTRSQLRRSAATIADEQVLRPLNELLGSRRAVRAVLGDAGLSDGYSRRHRS